LLLKISNGPNTFSQTVSPSYWIGGQMVIITICKGCKTKKKNWVQVKYCVAEAFQGD
jgi:hypothetical protein